MAEERNDQEFDATEGRQEQQTTGKQEQQPRDQSSTESARSKEEGFIGSKANDGSNFDDEEPDALDKQSDPSGQANRDESDPEGQDDNGSF